jgi:hypothetical protein
VVHGIRYVQNPVRHPVEGHTHARHGRCIPGAGLCVVQGTDGTRWCQTIHPVLNVYLDEAAIGQRYSKDCTTAAIGRFPSADWLIY